MILDTQILSYIYKGAMPAPAQAVRISSITAAEFLLVQSPTPTAANWYPILQSRLRQFPQESRQLQWDSKKHAAAGKHRTDRMIIGLGPNHPSYIEFGSLALADLINGQDKGDSLLASSISHLDKYERKTIEERFEFMVDFGVQCIPLSRAAAEKGILLLAEFLERYNPKPNFRNTLNDALILGAALDAKASLHTADALLQRFSASVLDAPSRKLNMESLIVEFGAGSSGEKIASLEAKGYVNRGWRVAEGRRKHRHS